MGLAYALIVAVDDDENVFDLAMMDGDGDGDLDDWLKLNERIAKHYVASFRLSEKVKGMFCHKRSVD